MASAVPMLSRSPLSSPFGARAPERCSPGRGSAFYSLAALSDSVKNFAKRHATVVGSQRGQNVRLKQFLDFPSVVFDPFHLGVEDVKRAAAPRDEFFSGPGFVRFKPPKPDPGSLEIGCDL